MKKKLAIIGASYLQLPLVMKAKSLGIETHCFAWEEGAVCKKHCDYFYPISVLEQDKILSVCEAIKVDGITTIATDMVVPTICFVAEKLNLISNSYASSLKSTNKGEMRKAFELYSIKIPKYKVTRVTNVDLKEFRSPLIVKPVDRSGSKGVQKVTSDSQLRDAITTAMENSFTKQVIIEEYIEGEEISVETISWKGKHYVLAITDKVTTGNPYFVEIAHHQPSKFLNSLKQEIVDITHKVLNALDIKYGASHSEFKITETGEIYIIETGARMGGDFIGSHLVQLSTGYDFLKGVIDVSLNQFQEPLQLSNEYSGVYFLSKETEKLLPYFYISNDFDVQKEILKNELSSIRNSNDRSGYLIYRSTNKISLM